MCGKIGEPQNREKNMFKVLLYSSSDEISAYETPVLQYAKRYADLYRDDCPFVEILLCDDDGDRVIETFGVRLRTEHGQK